MRNKIIILALVICLLSLPVFQVQGQTNPKPVISDTTQGTPITGEDFTLNFLVSDSDGVDIARTYVYFRIFDGVSTPEYPTVIETSSGVYQSTVTAPVNASIMYYVISASDDLGLWSITDVLNRNVQDNMNPVAVSIFNVDVADLGMPYHFNGSYSMDNVGIAYYNWTFVHDGTTIALNGTEPVFNFTKYGTYSITLKVTDADGNWDTTTISISTNDGINPDANPGIDQVEIIGHSMEFNGSASTDNVGIEEYVWTFYHNFTLTTLNGTNPEFIFWEVGAYNVTLTVTDAAGNSDQESYIVHVLHDNLIGPSEVPWWTIGLAIMILLVIITTVFIFRTPKN